MQPSNAFSILKQLTKTGNWKILDNTVSPNVACDREPVVNCVASIVPLSDLNRDRTDSKEIVFSKLRSEVNELVGNVDDKENVDVECMNVTCTSGQVQSEPVEHKLLTDGQSDRTDDNLNEVDAYSVCDAASVKLCNATKKQRKTFSLTADVLPCSTAQLPVQSDSIDVVNLIGEVADMYQRSGELSYGNTIEISTQEIEAHEDKFDGFKQQRSVGDCTGSMVPVSQQRSVGDFTGSMVPVSQQHSVGDFTGSMVPVPISQSQCAMHGTSLQSVHSYAVDEQQVDMSHLSENTKSVVERAPLTVNAVACTAVTDSETSHSVPLSAGAPVKAPQYNDVVALSVMLHSDDRNNSSVSPHNTDLAVVSLPDDDCQQVYMPPAAESEAMCDMSAAHRDETGSSDADVVVVGTNSETKQLYSEEVLSSQVTDTSDDDESGDVFINT